MKATILSIAVTVLVTAVGAHDDKNLRANDNKANVDNNGDVEGRAFGQRKASSMTEHKLGNPFEMNNPDDPPFPEANNGLESLKITLGEAEGNYDRDIYSMLEGDDDGNSGVTLRGSAGDGEALTGVEFDSNELVDALQHGSEGRKLSSFEEGGPSDTAPNNNTHPSPFHMTKVPYNGLPSKEELHGKKGGDNGSQNNVPAQVAMTANEKGKGNTAGVPSRHGEMEVSAFGTQLSKIPVLVFKGLNAETNKPLVIKRSHVNAPIPKIWKPEGNGDMIGEDAQVWFGEEVGQSGVASAILMASSDGGITGSISDGVNTYIIETEYEEDTSNGHSNWRPKIKFNSVRLSELPPPDVPPQADLEGTLRSNLRKVGIDDANELNEVSRHLLEQDCKDVTTFNGAWYDSDGPNYTCAWYSQNNNCALSSELS